MPNNSELKTKKSLSKLSHIENFTILYFLGRRVFAHFNHILHLKFHVNNSMLSKTDDELQSTLNRIVGVKYDLEINDKRPIWRVWRCGIGEEWRRSDGQVE